MDQAKVSTRVVSGCRFISALLGTKESREREFSKGIFTANLVIGMFKVAKGGEGEGGCKTRQLARERNAYSQIVAGENILAANSSQARARALF